MGRGVERLLLGHVWTIYALMYAPLVLMGLFSLNSSEFMAFPLESFTFRWYQEVVVDTRLLGGFLTTLSIALPVTLITTTVGSMAALALTRFAFRLKWLLLLLLIVPFFVPKIVFAVAQVIFLDFVQIPKGLITVWIAQSLIILPFTTIIIASVLFRIDQRLEEAASDLGATPWQSFRLVTLPLMKNGIMAGAFISFVLSTAEYTVSFFTSGRSQPLSILVASDFRFNLSPKLSALAMLIVVFNVLIIVVSEILRQRAVQRRSSQLQRAGGPQGG